ncbi:MAG: DUF2271 domain-containing protein, partial [Verrucomicrobiota bacterium]
KYHQRRRHLILVNKLEDIKFVKAGKYTVYLEAAREHGTYQIIRQELDCNGTATKIDLKGNVEISSAALDYHHKSDGK